MLEVLDAWRFWRFGSLEVLEVLEVWMCVWQMFVPWVWVNLSSDRFSIHFDTDSRYIEACSEVWRFWKFWMFWSFWGFGGLEVFEGLEALEVWMFVWQMFDRCSADVRGMFV